MAGNTRLLGALAAALVLSSGAASASGSSASSIEIAHWNGTAWMRFATPHVGGTLYAVTAISPTDAWAVGVAGERPLALRWNGASWRRAAIPARARSGNGPLAAVSASSPKDVWAVGGTLIEHWNGVRWRRVPSPASGSADYLRGVSALSPTNAWAVGSHGSRTLILHWNGKRWVRTRSPNPGRASKSPVDVLSSIAAISSRDVWAVGRFFFARRSGAQKQRTLVLHWNGRHWARVASPNPAPLRHGNALIGVAGSGRTTAWAVGYHGTGRRQDPLVESWNGHSWRSASAPAGSSGCCMDALTQIAAVSAHDAWAAGGYSDKSGAFAPLVEHWDGTSWAKSPVSSAIGQGILTGIAAMSDKDIWVVGNHGSSQRR